MREKNLRSQCPSCCVWQCRCLPDVNNPTSFHTNGTQSIEKEWQTERKREKKWKKSLKIAWRWRSHLSRGGGGVDFEEESAVRAEVCFGHGFGEVPRALLPLLSPHLSCKGEGSGVFSYEDFFEFIFYFYLFSYNNLVIKLSIAIFSLLAYFSHSHSASQLWLSQCDVHCQVHHHFLRSAPNRPSP